MCFYACGNSTNPGAPALSQSTSLRQNLIWWIVSSLRTQFFNSTGKTPSGCCFPSHLWKSQAAHTVSVRHRTCGTNQFQL